MGKKSFTWDQAIRNLQDDLAELATEIQRLNRERDEAYAIIIAAEPTKDQEKKKKRSWKSAWRGWIARYEADRIERLGVML